MPDVVFVPGFMQRGDAWAEVAEAVGQRYRSTCIDHATWTLSERLEEIRDAAPEGSVLAGYSMGGRLALHAALADPGRYSGLVTLGVSAGVEDHEERRRVDEKLAGWMEVTQIEAVVEVWERLPVFASQPERVVEAQRPGRLSHDPRRLAALLRTAGQGAMDSVWHLLPDFERPWLALAGAIDRPYAAAARRMASLAPGCRAALVENAGHAAQLERPEEVARLILEFLDERLG